LRRAEQNIPQSAAHFFGLQGLFVCLFIVLWAAKASIMAFINSLDRPGVPHSAVFKVLVALITNAPVCVLKLGKVSHSKSSVIISAKA